MPISVDATKIALPRGKVFFARKNAAGALGPSLFLGNCSKLEFATIGDDIAEVLDFTSNVSTPMKRITRKRAPEFPLSLYECNADNLALMFMADRPARLVQAATPVTNETIASVGAGGAGIRVGQVYRTLKAGPISSVTGVTSGANAMTLGTHYEISDAAVGLIKILALPGSAVEGDAWLIGSYTPTAYTATNGPFVILGGGVAVIEGELFYVGYSNVGPRHKLEIWNCSLQSDGSFPFIATDPAEFSLKVTALTDPNHADLFRVTEIP